MSKTLFVPAIMLIIGSFALHAPAQETPIRQATPPQDRAVSTNFKLDRPAVEYFAAKLVLCNNAEIEMGMMAASKASTPEVKEFAKMLATEHAQANTKLQPFLPNYAVRPKTSASPSGVSQTENETDQQRLASERNERSAVPQRTEGVNPRQEIVETDYREEAPVATLKQLHEICRMAHQNYMEVCTKKLSQHSGEDFDTEFLRVQAATHVALIAELKALESKVDGEFQSVVREAKTNAEEHLVKVEKLCKHLDQNTTSSRDR